MLALIGRPLIDLLTDHDGATTWTPAVEAFVRDKEFVVRCEVPGVDPRDITVTVEGPMLRITGERKPTEKVEDQPYWLREITHGRFAHSFALPEGVDPEQLKASYRLGVLEITIPLPVTKRTVPIAVEAERTAA
jgi:HSP20 family protein